MKLHGFFPVGHVQPAAEFGTGLRDGSDESKAQFAVQRNAGLIFSGDKRVNAMGGGVGNGHLQDGFREKLTVSPAAGVFFALDPHLRN